MTEKHMEVFDREELTALGNDLMRWACVEKKLPPMKFVSFLIYFVENLKKDMGVKDIIRGDFPADMT